VLKLSLFVVSTLVLTATLSSLSAHSYGPAPRVTAAPGDDQKACTLCHAGTLNSGTGSVQILLLSGPVYIPGIKQRVRVQVSDPNQQRWGFEMTARLNSDLESTQAGEFTPVDNFTQVICEDASPKPCPTGVAFIQHTSAGTRNGQKGGAIFDFDWTPPATNAGPVTLFAAGNAANGNSSPVGDFIYTTNVQLNPVTAVAPSVPAGNIFSAATLAAGPVAPNSWVTIFGSNLSATTRGLDPSDIRNGALPDTLDGVGVLITANGAPRRAYPGYVSPNQVNFALPSDTTATTVQVQLKNPAGIITAIPITVQANAQQLLTTDGKFVSGSHANGTPLGKDGLGPATPGETITLNGTGCGAVTPAQVPGQIPTQAVPLTTLPVVSIGGTGATVTAATLIPGTAAVCAITVQVPGNAANGDQPVTVQAGTFTSAPVLLTIQR
jgi:uncharacterized protein (TIGR03437 family)